MRKTQGMISRYSGLPVGITCESNAADVVATRVARGPRLIIELVLNYHLPCQPARRAAMLIITRAPPSARFEVAEYCCKMTRAIM